ERIILTFYERFHGNIPWEHFTQIVSSFKTVKVAPAKIISATLNINFDSKALLLPSSHIQGTFKRCTWILFQFYRVPIGKRGVKSE
ncbi:MAG: hypothetical protein AAF348_19665, partial [Bacteroidota bacterium]